MILGLFLFYIILGGITGIGLWYLLRAHPHRRWYTLIFLLAILIHIIAIFAINMGLFNNQFEHPDSNFYMQQVDAHLHGDISLLPLRPSHILAGTFYLFGKYVTIPEVINAVLASFALLFISLFASTVFSSRTGKITSILLLIDPAFAYWTSQILKEAVFIFTLSFILYLYTRPQNWRHILSYPLSFYVLFVYDRIYFGYILVATLALVSLLRLRKEQLQFFMFSAIFIAITALIIIPFIASKMPHQGTPLTDFVNTVRSTNSQSHRAFYTNAIPAKTFSSVHDIFSFFPAALLIGIFMPQPWTAHTFYKNLFSVGMMYWYALLPLIVAGIYYSYRNTRTYTLIGYSLGTILLLSYFVTTPAALIRWRLPSFLFLFPFASFALDHIMKRCEP